MSTMTATPAAPPPPPPPPAAFLDVRQLHKSFDAGKNVVLSGASLTVPRGSLVTILGKSGTGKSVFLKCLAGIVRPDQGEICFEGRPLNADNPEARAEFRRRCSYQFQSNALFDSLTAYENVALPLEQTTRLPNREIRDRCLHALRQLELETSAHHFPSQLSGGMQKRLALARAIVTRPEIVLFDEPTAGLDPLRRNSVFEMIAKYRRQFGFTAVIVTHDIPEALVASDRVALLDDGTMRFQGTPAEFLASTDDAVHAFRDSADALRQTLAALPPPPPVPASTAHHTP
ncbi:ABC transporter ATP-binding protein [Geminisphaera colitermitum]|uniref:ABC transporter ATP-binding protein n=1 Tax=Geminisphaera colitermitum TaxID=1148786 RepID=UPI0009DDFD0A|nr:ATP-binding cassette domain-containing protein [Geminisphaera colitermitum]